MAELAYATDLKSVDQMILWVRVPSSLPLQLRKYKMTWTVIFEDSDKKGCLSTTVVHGLWGEANALSTLSSNNSVNGEIVAIIPGNQNVYFNKLVVSGLLSKKQHI